jgi:hypothetical protein
MAYEDTIRLYRGNKSGLPTVLDGEPVWAHDTGELYVGGRYGNVRIGYGITPEAYGAKGDGTTDDTAAIQAAITAAGENGCVLFSDRTYLVTTTVTLPATNLTLIGSGTAVLDTSGTNSILKQTNHGALIRIDGIKFTGGGYGIEFACADESVSYDEYAISNCTFSMDTGIYGLYMVGAREGTIENCYFTTGNGIYRSHSNVCFIRGCIFKSTGTQVGTAIYDNGDAVSTSCGLQINSCVIMGYDIGIKIVETDDFNIESCTVDYNTTNIQILGQDTGTILGNYLGSVGTNPAISVGLSGAVGSQNIIISDNKIVGHATTAGYDCISVYDSANVSILNNYIAFYTRYGINYGNCTYLNISHNHIAPRGSGMSATPYAVYTADDETSNKITWNNFDTYEVYAPFAKQWENYGPTTAGVSPVNYLMHPSAQVSDLLTSGSPEFAEIDVWGDSRIGIIAGEEMAVNGGFDSDATGWTAGDCTLASIAGGQSGNCLEVTRTGGSWQTVAQEIAGFVVGRKYRYTCYIKSGTSGNELAYLISRPATAVTDAYDTIAYGTTSGSWVQLSLTFTATETSYDIILFKVSATAGTMLFDTVSSVELVPLVDAGYATADTVTMGGDVDLATGKVVKVAGTQVVGARALAEADAKSDYTTGDLDSEAEVISAVNATNTKINNLLAKLRTHGLIAT